MSKRRVFSSNTEVFMSDHIATVARTAKQGGKQTRISVPQCGVPRNALDGITSYLSYPGPIRPDCSKIQLYPYGSFYNIVPYPKYVIIPKNCGCDM